MLWSLSAVVQGILSGDDKGWEKTGTSFKCVCENNISKKLPLVNELLIGTV